MHSDSRRCHCSVFLHLTWRTTERQLGDMFVLRSSKGSLETPQRVYLVRDGAPLDELYPRCSRVESPCMGSLYDRRSTALYCDCGNYRCDPQKTLWKALTLVHGRGAMLIVIALLPSVGNAARFERSYGASDFNFFDSADSSGNIAHGGLRRRAESPGNVPDPARERGLRREVHGKPDAVARNGQRPGRNSL